MSRTGDDPDSRFRRLAQVLCEDLTNHQIPFRPFESPELPLFRVLPAEKKQQILDGLEETFSLHSEAASHRESLLDSPRLLWRALSRLKLTPHSDIFDKIEDGDVVELYSLDQYQLFRNLTFFRYVSCTLEQLVSLPVWELARYPAGVQENLIALTRVIADGHLKETISPEPRPYVVQEIAGTAKYELEILIKHISPVSRGKQPVGVIVVNRSRILKRGNTDAPAIC